MKGKKGLYVAAEAEQLGYGGITLLARLTGMSRVSIHSGLAGLDTELKGRVRAPGGGRKPAQQAQPELFDALDALVALMKHAGIRCRHFVGQAKARVVYRRNWESRDFR